MDRKRHVPGPIGRILALTLLVATCCPAVAQADENQRETLIKAAIIYKLAKFVEWPATSFAQADSTLNLCLLGPTPLTAALTGAEGRPVRGHPVKILQIDDPRRIDSCHVVYITGAQQRQLPDLMARFDGRPVLSVSEIEGFASHGGVIGLVRRGNRLGFQVNLGNARRSGLTVSAPLLELAEVIGRDS
jgi:hypothetical protein